MKILFKIIKKIVLSLCLLYSVNLIMTKAGITIPINYYTIGTVSILGSPGLIGLVILYKFLI